MKKGISLFIITGGIFLLTGCFNSGEKVTCTYEYKGNLEIINEALSLTIKESKVTSMDRTINYDLSKYDKAGKTKYYTNIKNVYASFESKAFTSKTELKDSEVVMDLSIDFTKATKEELDKYSTSYSEFITNIYTREQVIKKINSLGYKCK